MEIRTACFVTSMAEYRPPARPLKQIAMCGRSNVGKSSLINCLTRRNALAKVGAAPGKTRLINLFEVNGAFYLVDLPGYGYAKASKTEVEKWGKMIERYLKTSKQLRCVFLLIDIRHEPGSNDRMMYDWIVSNGFTPVIIATKLDKIKRSQIDKQIKLIRTTLGASGVEIIPFSAVSKQGREEIYEIIDKILEDTV